MASYFLLLLVLSTPLPATSVSTQLKSICLTQRAIPVSQALEKGFLRHRNLPLDFFDQSGNTYTSELEEDSRGSPKSLVAYSNNNRIVEDASVSLEAYVASRIEECLALLTDEKWEAGLSQSKQVMQLESEVAVREEALEHAAEASLNQSKRVMRMESELVMRDEALAIVRREFESIKTKVAQVSSRQEPEINKYVPHSWNLILAGLIGGATVLLFMPLCLAGICCWIRKRWKGNSTPLEGQDVELGVHQTQPVPNLQLPAIQYDFPVGRLPEAVANN